MAHIGIVLTIATLMCPLCSAECSAGACLDQSTDETSLLQVDSTIKRADERMEEIPRKMIKMQKKSHMPKMEEIAEGELPEVLRKAADHDMDAIKKAQAARAKKANQNLTSASVGKANITIANPSPQVPKAAGQAAAHTATQTAPKLQKGQQEMQQVQSKEVGKSAKKVVSQPAAQNVMTDDASMKELTQITNKKVAALHKEEAYMKKAEAAQKSAREAAAEAMQAMKNSSIASLQAARWHEAATAQHAFFEKAERAENAALENDKAKHKLEEAQISLQLKAAKKQAANTELLSGERSAASVETAAFNAEQTTGVSLATEHTNMAKAKSHESSLASYEKPSRDDWADWAW